MLASMISSSKARRVLGKSVARKSARSRLVDSVFRRNSLPYKVSIALNGNSVYAALRCSMGVKSHPIGD